MGTRVLSIAFESIAECVLPEQPSTCRWGTLLFRPGHGVDIELTNSFHEAKGEWRVGDSHVYPVVHGVTREGEAFTLIDAVQRGRGIAAGSGGLRIPERLSARRAIFGAHLSESAVFTEGRFRIPGLPIVLGQRMISDTLDKRADTGRFVGHYSVDTDTWPTVSIGTLSASVSWYTTFTSNVDTFQSINVAVSGWLRVIPNSPQSLEWYLTQYQCMAGLHSLVAGGPLSADHIELLPEAGALPLTALVAIHQSSKVWPKQIHEVFIPAVTLLDNWSAIVTAWCQRHADLEQPVKLTLGTDTADGLWLHMTFVSLMQALEGFHRATNSGTYISEEEFKEVQKTLTAALPTSLDSDHRASLKARIHYGNDLSLRKRLKDLAGTLPEHLRHLVLGETGKAMDRWVDTRNYFTHWDESSRESILTDEEMYHACIRLREFFRSLVLGLVGVPPDAMTNAYQRHSNAAEDLAFVNITDCRRRDPEYHGGVLMTITKKDGP